MSQDAFEARKGIGLLGGTFDPIHQGHLALAASALEQLKLQQIDFLLAPARGRRAYSRPSRTGHG